MSFFRIKSIKTSKGKSVSYLYLVQNKWYKRKHGNCSKGPRQRVLAYLGKVEGLEPFSVQEVFRKSHYKCTMCGRMDTLCIDHIIPSSKGGSNHIDNLQVLCQRCNHKKRDKIPKGVGTYDTSFVAKKKKDKEAKTYQNSNESDKEMM